MLSLIVGRYRITVGRYRRKYQNYKVHDQGCSEHPEFQESTQYSQSYGDLKMFDKIAIFVDQNWQKSWIFAAT